MKKISVVEYAKHRRVSPQWVGQMIKKGLIPESARIKKGRRYFIDPIKADRVLKKTLNPAYLKTKPKDFAEARTKNEHFKAKLAELEFKRKSGELVSAAEIKTVIGKFFGDAEKRLRRLRKDVAPLLLDIVGDKGKVEQLLSVVDGKVEEAIQELTRYQTKGVKKHG